jgi:hypothetical protein
MIPIEAIPSTVGVIDCYANVKHALGLVARSQPRADRRLVAHDFGGLKIQFNFAGGGFGAIAGVNQVHLAAGAEIPANRSCCRLLTARGAEHFADHANGFQPFDDRRHHRAAGDEFFERRIPTLGDVLGIVLLGQFGCDPHQLHLHHIEAFVFKASQNTAG